jgi:hypothetical protein
MKYLLLFASLSLFLFAGCSSLDVSTDYDPAQDFSTYKTYAWFQGELPADDALSANPLIQKRVANSVDKNLQAKGYKLAEGGDPDFVVIIHAGLKERMQVTNTGYGGYGYGGYGWGRYGAGWGGYNDTHVSYYDEATLVVDIADFQKKELVWRGMGTGVVSTKERTAEESQQVADEVIMKIMMDFPPTK